MTNATTKKRVAIVTGASSDMGIVWSPTRISKSKDLKPSSDLILVEGNIGEMDTAIKVANAGHQTL